MSSFSRLLKRTTSSILFKNSGANVLLRAFSITPLECSEALFFLADVLKPTPCPKSFSCLVPIFDVIIITVFLKSIFRPKLSVTWPSSRT